MAEILNEDADAPVRILGVNGFGYESGNGTATAGRTLPWLQDTGTANVWTLWNVTYRDVVILDAENKVAGVYNLTSQDLANPDNYAALKAMILAALE